VGVGGEAAGMMSVLRTAIVVGWSPGSVGDIKSTVQAIGDGDGYVGCTWRTSLSLSPVSSGDSMLDGKEPLFVPMLFCRSSRMGFSGEVGVSVTGFEGPDKSDAVDALCLRLVQRSSFGILLSLNLLW
jgi:hypothetical protein